MLSIVSPGCLAAEALCGIALWAVPDGAAVVWAELAPCVDGAIVDGAGDVPDGAVVVGVAVDCAQAGAATSIVVISRGAAQVSSVAFIAGFSVAGWRWAPIRRPQFPKLAAKCGGTGASQEVVGMAVVR